MELNFDKKAQPNKEFTFVLIHANGTPRTYRMSLKTIRKLLFTFGIGLAALLTMLIFTSLSSWRFWKQLQNPNTELLVVGSSNENSPPLNADEKNKEISPPTEILTTGLSNTSVPSLFVNRPGLVNPEDVKLRIVNPRLQTNGENTTLQFDLAHSNPDAGQAVRGFIVVLLRSGNFVFSYPTAAFNLKDSAIINYTKGETFGVSRYRQVFAEFKNLPKIMGQSVFQILLFSHDGNVILSQQYIEKK